MKNSLRALRWIVGLFALIGLVGIARVGGQGFPGFQMYGIYNGAPKALAVDSSGNISASVSGADGAILDGVSAAIKATVKDYTNSNPVMVAISDANGDLISSFGGGTQYTEGDTDATLTGTVMLFETNTGTSAVGAVSTTNPVPSNITQLGSAAIPMITTQADNQALTTDGLVVSAFMYCYDGTNMDLCPTSSGGAGVIDANTGRVTIATDDDVSDMATLIEAMMVAHDAADAGNPFKIGAKAETSLSGRTAVADGDRTDLFAGADGVLITRPYANLEDRVSGIASVTDGSSTSAVAAQGAGIRFCVTNIIVSNSSATNVTVDIRDGTAGSVIATVPAAANMGGAAIPLLVPLCGTANTAMAADPSAAASTVATTLIGFKTAL